MQSASRRLKSTLKIPRSNDAEPSDHLEPTTPKTPADEGIEFFESAFSQGQPPIRVHELKLDPDGGPNKDRAYVRLPPATLPYVLRVSIDPGTPASKNGVFKTNFPLDGGVFARDRFAERKLPTDFSKSIQVDLPISHAGAFVYWVEYDGEQPGTRIKGREGYFNIDPLLQTKARTPVVSSDRAIKPPEVKTDTYVNLPLDGVALLTLVSKWMGPLSSWRDHFAEAKDRGYNIIHWTPLQERGESDSPYSIRNQLKYDPSLFDEKADFEKDGGVSKVEEILSIANEEYGLLSLTDVVLNHTANDSPWLLDHPEAGFSPHNSPHLTPALELDTAIIEFSASLIKRGLPTRVTTAADVDALINALGAYVKALNLWQYYVFDVKAERASVKEALAENKVTPWDGPAVASKTVVELATIFRASSNIEGLGKLSKRFCSRVDGGVAAGFVQAAFTELTDADAIADAWIKVVDVLNVPLYEEFNEDTRVALDNIQNRLKYTRLDEHGPKLGDISQTLVMSISVAFF